MKHKTLEYISLDWDRYEARQRLEYLRRELRAERISMGELLELQTLVPYIDSSDVELLEAAGVCEQCRSLDCTCEVAR